MAPPIECEKCGTLVPRAMEIPSYTGQRGASVYRCASCDHFTWRWHGTKDGRFDPFPPKAPDRSSEAPQ